MGMSRMFTPICDRCNTEADWGEWYSQLAKNRAISEGWKIGAKYLCPECNGVGHA